MSTLTAILGGVQAFVGGLNFADGLRRNNRTQWSLGIMLLITGLFVIFVNSAKAETPQIYLCQSPNYSLVVGRNRDCPGIERKVRRALRVSLIANYRDSGLSPEQARREAARALPTYVCGWSEVRGCTLQSCQGGSSSSNGGELE